MKNHYKVIKNILITLFLILGWTWNVIQTTKKPVWDIRDERQHFDYINAISEGYLPKGDQPISSYTEGLIHDAPAWSDSMLNARGYIWKSWEANQPPMYYIILAVPNLIMKRYNIEPIIQVNILRLVSLSMLIIAVSILLLTAKKNNKYPVLYYSSLLTAGILTYIAKDYYTLGNDNLSVLFGAIMFYFCLKEFNRYNLFCMIVVSSVAMSFVKLSNMVLIIPLGLTVVSRKDLLKRETILKMIGLFLVFPIIKFLLFPNPVNTTQLWTFPGRNLVSFLTLFFGNMLGIPYNYSLWVGLFLCSALIYSIFRTRREKNNIYICMKITALLMILIPIFLNFTIRGVHWAMFRHYSGMYPFVISGIMCSFVNKIRLVNNLK